MHIYEVTETEPKEPDDDMFNQITVNDFKNYLIKRFDFKFSDVTYTEVRV